MVSEPFHNLIVLMPKSECTDPTDPDMSIWEVRGNKQHFTYSKIMLWVAFDRGLRLSEKRCFPCPNRANWLLARDKLYEEIMEKGLSSASRGLFSC